MGRSQTSYSPFAGFGCDMSTHRRATLELSVKQRTGNAISHIRAVVKVALLPVVACLALLLSVAPLRAQVQSGINGTVIDPSQAVISGARVTITNTSTGVVSNTVTSSAGTFNAVGLIPGDYSVVVDASGFRRSQTTVVVEIAKMSSVTVSLVPGAATETVNVTGTTISLNTTSPEVGTTLEPELVNVAPSRSAVWRGRSTRSVTSRRACRGSAISHAINGGVTFENEVQFNGVPVAFVQFQGNQTNINPPYEAVNEFRVSHIDVQRAVWDWPGGGHIQHGLGNKQLSWRCLRYPAQPAL